jgi:hypothetical protein
VELYYGIPVKEKSSVAFLHEPFHGCLVISAVSWNLIRKQAGIKSKEKKKHIRKQGDNLANIILHRIL